MFSLFAGYYRLWFEPQESVILVVGLNHAGKTTALAHIKCVFGGLAPLPAGKIPPTVGLNIGRVQIRRQKLVFWDVSGASSLRSLWDRYFGETHAIIYVVDASDRARLDESRDVLRGLLSNDELQDAPLLVLANKQDMPGALSPDERESRFELQSMLTVGQHVSVHGATATNGSGRQEGVLWLADVLKNLARAGSPP